MTSPNDSVFGQVTGLTKREYFAAMAMHGIVANSESNGIISSCVRDAIFFADELIKQLNENEE